MCVISVCHQHECVHTDTYISITSSLNAGGACQVTNIEVVVAESTMGL